MPEALAALVIVTVACSSLLLAVGQSLSASGAGIDTTRANLLAQDLMTEISTAHWTDSKEPNHWGPESDEINPNCTRADFDDVDDYDAWSGPPQTRNGQTYDSLQQALFPGARSHEYAQYVTSVRVECVSQSGDVLGAGQTSPYRRVTVQVVRAGEAAHKLSRVFSDHAELLGDTHWLDPNRTEPVASVEIVL